ncbi:MAG: NAD+ synthase [Phycisphaerae bacterium]
MILALAQFNPIVGDIDGNVTRVLSWIDRARDRGADVVVLPELAVVGYPPKDLLLKPSFVEANVAAVERIAAERPAPTVIVGYAEPSRQPAGRGLYNAAAVCRGGRIVAVHRKALLPTYDVFDESRYFEPAADQAVETLPAESGPPTVAGITICEDLWNAEGAVPRPRYHANPIAGLAEHGAILIINISASPFDVRKDALRRELFAAQCRRYGVTVACSNQVGANDDLVFDGASAVFDAGGRVVARAKAFAEDLLIVDLDAEGDARVEPYPDRIDSVLQALVLGTRDYVTKCGFKTVVVGLSGGVDSAVTAAIAVEALGPQAVRGVAMPSRYSSDHSLADARFLADNLAIRLDTIPIRDMHTALEAGLAEVFAGRPPDITEENLQARLRGAILMALSNKFGSLLLTTGNKSELAVGYCTLYGDMCGGLAVLSDVPKTTVYEVARCLNTRAGREIIPERTLTKPPSAELRPDQTDQDTLPPYAVLDAILAAYIEEHRSADEIIAAGHDRAVVLDVIRRVDRNEYKRKQAACGLKVTTRAFGTGRRMPIAARHDP